MQITAATSFQYSAADNSAINCLVSLDGSTPDIPFTAKADDPEQHGQDLYAQLIAGDYGPIAPYVAPPPRVPAKVTKRQAKEALIRQGKYQQALDAIEAIIDPTEKAIANNYWTESQAFERDNAVLNSLATTGLGMTQTELDDLFLYAVTL